MRALFLCCLLSFVCISCSKLIDVGEPSDRMSPGEVFRTDSAAAGALGGIYSFISNNGLAGGGTGISIFCGLYCDELGLMEGNQAYLRCYENTLTADESPFWGPLYNCVQHCNMALEGLNASTTLTAVVKKQLTGEAKFIRAFCYFYLVNFFGDVPLLTSSDINTNSTAARSSMEDVYAQIIADLQDAQNLLREEYLAGDAKIIVQERLRPNKWAAVALLARVYLFQKNWAAAEQEATRVIARSELYTIPILAGAFQAQSKEMIWGLEHRNATGVNDDASLFVLTHGPDPEGQPLYVNQRLLKAFEPGDLRLATWIGRDTTRDQTYYYPHKYRLASGGRSLTPYQSVLRLAEVLLIRAEAKVYINDLAGAWEDLKILRRRAGLGRVVAMSWNVLLQAIEGERRVELFTEWGHRWLDLKRYGKDDAVMAALSAERGVTWSPYKKLFPLPHEELRLNPKLVQNTGY